MAGTTRSWDSAKPKITSTSPEMTSIGWIVAVVILIVVYDKLPKTRPFIAGSMGVVALGIVLRYRSSVTDAFRELFFVKVE